jgi:hypothetical protein
MNNGAGGVHWKSVSQAWKYFGPPLRPCEEDVQYMQSVLLDKYGDQENIKAHLCGVTPEIATMDWPAGTNLVAVEQSQEMIRDVWPGDIKAKRNVVLGNWLETKPNKNHYDVVIGDGCFISVSYPDGYKTLAAILADTLKKDGLFVMRFFVQLENKESTDHVFEELLAGKIGSFHAFKWRLAMSLQPSSEQGVCLHTIFKTWQEANIDKKSLLAKTGWSKEAVETINLYENKNNYFSFATLPEVIELFNSQFHKESIYFPQYELGERCPIIVFRPR